MMNCSVANAVGSSCQEKDDIKSFSAQSGHTAPRVQLADIQIGWSVSEADAGDFGGPAQVRELLIRQPANVEEDPAFRVFDANGIDLELATGP